LLDRVRDQAVDAGADATVSLGRRLLTRILRRTEPTPAIEAALTDLTNEPDDEDFSSALRAQIKKALRADDQLRADLSAMLAAEQTRIVASGERSVAAHTISGIVATGDNPTIQR
jgi:hypothetical protein